MASHGLIGQRHHSLLRPLAVHQQLPVLQVQVLQADLGDLAAPHAGGEQQHHQALVPGALRRPPAVSRASSSLRVTGTCCSSLGSGSLRAGLPET